MTENVGPNEESETNLQVRARKLVRDYYNHRVVRQGVNPPVTLQQVYVVWFVKDLRNWKAMLGTVNPDGLYFEVTHDGEAGKTYVDEYEKQGQMIVTDPSIAKEREERDAMRAEILKAAEFTVKAMRDGGRNNASIAEELGITESVVRCLEISGNHAPMS